MHSLFAVSKSNYSIDVTGALMILNIHKHRFNVRGAAFPPDILFVGHFISLQQLSQWRFNLFGRARIFCWQSSVLSLDINCKLHNYRLVSIFLLPSGAEVQEENDILILPDEYLSPIYVSNEENAIFFIVHPSHRYAGVFQPLGIGMQFQVFQWEALFCCLIRSGIMHGAWRSEEQTCSLCYTRAWIEWHSHVHSKSFYDYFVRSENSTNRIKMPFDSSSLLE